MNDKLSILKIHHSSFIIPSGSVYAAETDQRQIVGGVAAGGVVRDGLEKPLAEGARRGRAGRLQNGGVDAGVADVRPACFFLGRQS